METEMQKSVEAMDSEQIERELSFAEGFGLDDPDAEAWEAALRAEQERRADQ